MLEISVYTGGVAETNGYLIKLSEEEWLAVDAPLGLAAKVDELGGRVTTLLLTHQHFDHCQDAARLQAQGARIWAYAPYSQDLTLESLIQAGPDSPYAVPPFTVDEVIGDQAHISAGGHEWAVAHVPGHSTDSVTFYLPGNGADLAGVLLAGDTLFSGSIGRTDFPRGSQQQLVTGIREKLLTLPGDTIVLPGHGEPTTIQDENRTNRYLR